MSQMAELYANGKSHDARNEMSHREQTVWCAVHTRYQHERLASELLASKGFETFLPTFARIHRWKDRKKEICEPLFPGYLFAANVGAGGMQVVMTAGVCSVVCTGGAPATIPTHEIEAIRKVVAGPQQVEPHAYLKDGDRVRVVGGPLAGIEGILIRKEKRARLIVSVDLLGRAAAVEIDGACVEPTDATRGTHVHALTSPPNLLPLAGID